MGCRSASLKPGIYSSLSSSGIAVRLWFSLEEGENRINRQTIAHFPVGGSQVLIFRPGPGLVRLELFF